ncbi:MAG: hypothetical protein V1888_00375 [archaeon]
MKIGHTPHSLEYMPMYLGNKNAFLHYTCNAPGEQILSNNGVEMLGLKFGCQNDKEVLLIPEGKYSKLFNSTKDQDQMRLNLELFLKNLN